MWTYREEPRKKKQNVTKKTAWSVKWVPGQLGLLYRETMPQKLIKEGKKERKKERKERKEKKTKAVFIFFSLFMPGHLF